MIRYFSIEINVLDTIYKKILHFLFEKFWRGSIFCIRELIIRRNKFCMLGRNIFKQNMNYFLGRIHVMIIFQISL